MFRGVTFPLITITFVRTLSFSVYTHTKELLARSWRKKKDKLSDALIFGAAGGITSGTIICFMSAPFELTKVERQLEYLIWTQRNKNNGTLGTNKFIPRSGFQAARDIYRLHGGLRGFYIGLRLHMYRDMTGSCIYFGLYDTMRMLSDRLEPHRQSYGIPAPFVSFLIVQPVASCLGCLYTPWTSLKPRSSEMCWLVRLDGVALLCYDVS